MKQKKLFLILSSLALAVAGVGVFATARSVAENFAAKANPDPYVLTLNGDNAVTGDTYLPQPVVKTVRSIVINNVLAKAPATSGNYARLAPHGAIYNYVSTDYHGRITGIQNMTVVYTGSGLELSVSRDLSGKIYTDKMNVTSGSPIDLTSLAPSYFYLTNGDNELEITSIQIQYTCAERDFLNMAQLGDEYTGEKDDAIYSMNISGSNITIKTLNLETNVTYNGTVSVDGDQVKAVLPAGNLFFNANEGRTKLTVDASKGIGAEFSGLAFNEVFNVEDFESFSADGVGYDVPHPNFDAMSGLRSNYHADYYSPQSSTQSLFGDKNWQIMNSNADYYWLYYTSNGGRNESKGARFRSTSAGLRYVNFESLLNVPKTMGKGTKFSFWAHGALNQARTGASSENVTLKVRLFFVNPVTSVSDSTGAVTQFSIPAGSDWKEYTITLDSSKEYYGYQLYFQSSNPCYVPIDDMKIYSADPYAEYEVPETPVELSYPEGTFMAVVGSYKLTIAIGNEDNDLVAVKISTTDVNATGITYDSGTKAFTITTTGSADGYTVGNITGTYDSANDQLVNVGCSGQIGVAISNVTLTRPDIYFDFEGTTAELQSTYKRRYRQSNAWNVDSSNSDRIVANTENPASGESSLSVRPCGSSYQGYSFSLMNDFATAKTVTSLEMWIYNPCDYDITLRIYYFKQTGLNGAGQVGLGSADKAKAHSWTYISRGFGSQNIYNFNIGIWTEDNTTNASTVMSAKVLFDNVLFY